MPLLLLLLLPLSLPSAAAVAATIPSFREAPAFRNAPECASPTTHNIHIAMTLDCTYLRGSLAAVFSILHHSSCPQNISFHFLSTPSDHPFLSATLSDTFPFLPFSLHLFDPHLVLTKISSSLRPALDHPLNYARIYLPQLLPLSLPRVIYLDSDLVLLDDIANLWSINLNSHVLGAPEYCHANFTRYFTLRFWSNPQFSRVFHDRKRHPCYFNTGVMVIDLVKWREGKYTERLEGWMILRKRHKIYQLGSLPPFLLVFSGAVEPVAHRWNQHGLGGDNLRGLCRPLHPGPVSLLHWSGKGKPWLRIDAGKPCPLDSLWAPYDLVYRPPSLISDSN